MCEKPAKSKIILYVICAKQNTKIPDLVLIIKKIKTSKRGDFAVPAELQTEIKDAKR